MNNNDGIKLKLARIKAGVTCTQLAKALGVSRSHLSLAENCQRRASASLIARAMQFIRDSAPGPTASD